MVDIDPIINMGRTCMQAGYSVSWPGKTDQPVVAMLDDETNRAIARMVEKRSSDTIQTAMENFVPYVEPQEASKIRNRITQEDTGNMKIMPGCHPVAFRVITAAQDMLGEQCPEFDRVCTQVPGIIPRMKAIIHNGWNKPRDVANVWKSCKSNDEFGCWWLEPDSDDMHIKQGPLGMTHEDGTEQTLAQNPDSATNAQRRRYRAGRNCRPGGVENGTVLYMEREIDSAQLNKKTTDPEAKRREKNRKRRAKRTEGPSSANIRKENTQPHELAHWPYDAECESCKIAKMRRGASKRGRATVYEPGKRMYVMDVMGPHPVSSGGARFLLVIGEPQPGRIGMVAMKTKNAATLGFHATRTEWGHTDEEEWILHVEKSGEAAGREMEEYLERHNGRMHPGIPHRKNSNSFAAEFCKEAGGVPVHSCSHPIFRRSGGNTRQKHSRRILTTRPDMDRAQTYAHQLRPGHSDTQFFPRKSQMSPRRPIHGAHRSRCLDTISEAPLGIKSATEGSTGHCLDSSFSEKPQTQSSFPEKPQTHKKNPIAEDEEEVVNVGHQTESQLVACDICDKWRTVSSEKLDGILNEEAKGNPVTCARMGYSCAEREDWDPGEWDTDTVEQKAAWGDGHPPLIHWSEETSDNEPILGDEPAGDPEARQFQLKDSSSEITGPRDFQFPKAKAFPVVMVTKDIRYDKENLEQMAAVAKEMATIRKRKTIDLGDPREWQQVAAEDPEAQVLGPRMLTSIKHWEREMKCWAHKGRLVALGNDVRTTEGAKAIEEDLFGASVSLNEMRMVTAHAITTKDGILVSADIDNAHLQAEVKGPAKWMRLPKHLRPEGWSPDMKDPVVKMCRALYGLEEAGSIGPTISRPS